MKPIGPLMVEHRLIERMVALLKKEFSDINHGKEVNSTFMDAAMDFFKTYADRTHHGKEEDILCRDLAKKQLTPGLKKVKDELVEEHKLARQNVRTIVSANEEYAKGNTDALNLIKTGLNELIGLYPAHIEKEDKQFFYPAQEYFSKEEQEDMLKEFWDFDRNMIHEKYKRTVEHFEVKSG